MVWLGLHPCHRDRWSRGLLLPQERTRRSSVVRLRHVTRFSPLVISAALKFMVIVSENSDNVITNDTFLIYGIMLYCISLCLTFEWASGIRSWLSGFIGLDPRDWRVNSGLSVLLPLRVLLGHLSWNNSSGSATAGIGANTIVEKSISHDYQPFQK
jgi:hypothetical protein